MFEIHVILSKKRKKRNTRNLSIIFKSRAILVPIVTFNPKCQNMNIIGP